MKGKSYRDGGQYTYAFYNNPTWSGFGYIVIDATMVALPGVPNVRGGYRAVGSLIDRSAYLKTALQKRVKSYSELRNMDPPDLTAPGGSWERHHIIAGKYANKYNSTYNNMPCIFTPKAWHTKITSKQGGMSSTLNGEQAAQAHVNAYTQLAQNAADDSERAFWEWNKLWCQTFIERTY